MRTIAEFFKNAILGGLLVIVPLLLVWGAFAQSLATIGRLAAPILRFVPKAMISDTPEHRSILAVILLIVLSFALGALPCSSGSSPGSSGARSICCRVMPC